MPELAHDGSNLGVRRVSSAALLLCLMGCLPDPKGDPCRRQDVSCDADAALMDAGDEEDAALDAGVRPDAQLDGALDAAVDADVQPQPDAGRDATVPRDAALDAAPPRDATIPDASGPQDPGMLPLLGDLGVHDPTIIEATGGFVIFSTGRGIAVKRSSDLLTWENQGAVFDNNPSWIAQQVPGATDLWAPDIAYYGGKYHLYYSASTFGSRDSCIGHATATDLTTLDFVDQGPVVCTEESDDYNAIDPGFIVDDDGTAWLSFGSFWSGIKLIRLDADGQRDGTDMYALASRDTVQAVEAPHLVKRGDYYYLFVSFDLCCRGSGSTYRIMVGRSLSVTGPYVDADGKPMLAMGGGSTVVIGNQRWRGPGHNAVLSVGGAQYLVYHAYDATQGGAATLRIAELSWDSAGWPVAVGP